MNTALMEPSPPALRSRDEREILPVTHTNPGEYIGTLPGFRDLPAIDLYNLVVPVGDHPVGSTVSRRTLEKHGYRMPALVRRFHGQHRQ